METYLWPLLILLAALAFFAGGIMFLYPWLRKRQGYHFEDEIESILLPFVYNAICSAYKLSEMAIDDGMSRLVGLDKKAIADAVYGMLPDTISLGDGRVVDIGIVKKLVPPELWERWVQNAFDRFTTWYTSQDARFDELFEEWMAENAPELDPAEWEKRVSTALGQ